MYFVITPHVFKVESKRRHEQALTETAAKVQLLDVDGEMVKELIFDETLTQDTVHQYGR